MITLVGGEPEAAAVLSPEGEALTYRELERRVNALARELAEAGIEAGDAVALAMPEGPDMLLAALAAASAGACLLLNPALQESEIEHCLTGASARALLAPPESPACRAAARTGIPCLSGAGPAPGLAQRRPPAFEAGTRLLLYTSATTGEPKLVPMSEANLASMVATSRTALELTGADRFLSMMPLFHLQGLIAAVAQLAAGGSVVATSGFDPRRFLGWIEEYRPTWYTAGPTLHRAILALGPGEVFARCRLRFVRSVGAPLPVELMAELESALCVPVIEGYGTTEVGLVTSNPLPPRRRKPGSVGICVGPELALHDGEIVVRGAAVTTGYAGDPEAGGDAFREGWFRTGDLGWLDEEGYLYVTGRIKEIINRGGEKVQPLEVDRVLAAHPAVQEAAAFAVAHPTLGEDVAAVAVLRSGASARESELRQFARSRLAAFKVPRRILFVEAIPKGPTGKPRRSVLAAQYAAAASAPRAPEDALEARLAGIWAEMLGLAGVGVDEDFFVLGGNSLLAASMLVRVEREYGSRLPVFSEPATIERMAMSIRSNRAAPLNSPLLFAIPAACENPYSFHLLAGHLGAERPVSVLRNPVPLHERGAYTVERVAELLMPALRAACPAGPYLLIGDCFGGMVAFEIARRLIEEGAEVGLLALIDTPMPNYPSLIRHWRIYLRALFSLDWIRRSGHPARDLGRGAWGFLCRLERRLVTHITRLLFRAHATAALPAALDEDAANRVAARTYTPQRYRGRIVQFAAADEWMTRSTLDSRLGWRDVAAGGFEARRIPGRHDRLLAEPYVRELAVHLAALIDEARSGRNNLWSPPAL